MVVFVQMLNETSGVTFPVRALLQRRPTTIRGTITGISTPSSPSHCARIALLLLITYHYS